ncbi:transcription factor kayak isoform X2 [Sitophilus oryzae]|uniref:Transcription factor kayak isoform X2 n=1 Tax=Sitophilus oryzae TaxID=7048 RepID=A0A6J2Y9F4_SITOR|nr:transcription factor kayak isoform X2 [Sitophilus oryzae]
MVMDLSDGTSNHSDFSNDSQNSQMSGKYFKLDVNSTSVSFIALEGLNSGVPTRTTPTLTPTTLRNIEQTFIELQSKPEQHENEARFVPPLVHSIGNNQYISASDASDIYSHPPQSRSPIWQNSLSQSSSDSNTRSTPPLAVSNASTKTAGPGRRNMGGRKPAKVTDLSPEEEERRRIRRERNKAAAARCRKRRVDHTNALMQEVDELEHKKQKLIDERQQLQMLKDQLEYLLESHQSSPQCRKQTESPPDVKPFDHIYYDKSNDRVKTEVIEPMDDIFVSPSPARKVMLSSALPISKPPRPNSLNVTSNNTVTTSSSKHQNPLEIAGIPISTPSTGMIFNFESMMGGGTGLTPVSAPLVPSCSTQQRNAPTSTASLMMMMDAVVSPDSHGPPKLVSL